MAQRRMFSLQIVDTDAFLDMPQSSQLLYFHLAMRADDDGFVSNPKKIARSTGASDDDFKVLLTKRFLLSFDSGVVVIKHWRIHNYIQKDRYNETKYTDELSRISVKDNGSYTECTQDVSSLDTQVRLGKVRLEETKTVYGDCKNVRLTVEQHQTLTERYGRSAINKLIGELSTYMASNGKAYKDHHATLLNWAKRKGIVEILTQPQPTSEFEEKLSPAQVAENQQRIDAIKERLVKNFKI
jgi:hypothetical protein